MSDQPVGTIRARTQSPRRDATGTPHLVRLRRRVCVGAAIILRWVQLEVRVLTLELLDGRVVLPLGGRGGTSTTTTTAHQVVVVIIVVNGHAGAVGLCAGCRVPLEGRDEVVARGSRSPIRRRRRVVELREVGPRRGGWILEVGRAGQSCGSWAKLVSEQFTLSREEVALLSCSRRRRGWPRAEVVEVVELGGGTRAVRGSAL